VARDCEAAQVDLDLDLDPALPALRVDPDQLRQAILNLLRNGKEAMPEGGRLTLGARAAGRGVEIFVRDQGSGIPDDAQDRIFDPFYSTKLTGTGLGLALTQQIVHEHGATLQVTSSAEKGTEFAVRFEDSPPGAEAPRAPLHPLEAESALPARGSERREP
jgi:signal transduction histidine kinase